MIWPAPPSTRPINLVVGKFLPLHEGHHLVIDRALADGPTIVIVLWSGRERRYVSERANWLQEIHPAAVVRTQRDELPVDVTDRDLSFRHAVLIEDSLQARDGMRCEIRGVYGSEPYVHHLAEYFRATPVLVDPERKIVPISATEIRDSPWAHWRWLRAPVRAALCKRIVCLGAESTGTTTLAQDLAALYKTNCVPEYGRLFYEGRRYGEANWSHEDLRHIAEMQRRMENQLARTSQHAILICDTNDLATHIWDEFLVGGESDIAVVNPCDLYILTEMLPWQDDGTRFGKLWRERMQEVFKQELRERNVRWTSVAGDRQDRRDTAAAYIDSTEWKLYAGSESESQT